MRKVNLGHHLTQRSYNCFVQRGIPTKIVIEPNFPKDIFWKSQEIQYKVIVPHLLRRLPIYLSKLLVIMSINFVHKEPHQDITMLRLVAWPIKFLFLSRTKMAARTGTIFIWPIRDQGLYKIGLFTKGRCTVDT